MRIEVMMNDILAPVRLRAVFGSRLCATAFDVTVYTVSRSLFPALYNKFFVKNGPSTIITLRLEGIVLSPRHAAEDMPSATGRRHHYSVVPDMNHYRLC